SRTPMQWTPGEYAGFSIREPWLPLSSASAVVNVESEEADPTSILTLYRELLRLRRSTTALTIGSYEPVATTGDLLAYVRRSPDSRLLVALNLGPQPFDLDLASLKMQGRVVLSTRLDRTDRAMLTDVSLRADEGVIVELT